jgi:hypothetical protein
VPVTVKPSVTSDRSSIALIEQKQIGAAFQGQSDRMRFAFIQMRHRGIGR